MSDAMTYCRSEQPGPVEARATATDVRICLYGAACLRVSTGALSIPLRCGEVPNLSRMDSVRLRKSRDFEQRLPICTKLSPVLAI